MPHDPVLIVGAGPVGQLTALLLSRHGIASRLIDRRDRPSTAPKAHAVNPRTLEICESVGVPAARLREMGAPADDAGWVRFVGTLSGPDFGHLPYERQGEDALADTPFPLTNIAQPKFEAALAEAIARNPRIEMMRGFACTAIAEGPYGVSAELKDVSSGIQTTLERSEEHTSELQSLMRISYAVFCLKKKKTTIRANHKTLTHSTTTDK